MPLGEVRFLVSQTDPSLLGPCQAEIAFAGRSNAGKSSLLNALLRKNLARVSGTPGRTRTISVFLVGREQWMVDLPGYGYASGPAASRAGWGPMIEGYMTGRESLRMVFVLIDAEIGPTKLDLQMLRWLQSEGVPWRVVAAKADQISASRVQARKSELAQAVGVRAEDLAWVSVLKGYGVRELRRDAEALLGL